MATDGPTPPPCDPEILKTGTLVLMTHSIPSNAMEIWVKKVAALSGQRVDWHFAGGSRACVLALGDLARARQATRDLMPEHDELQRREVESLDLGDGYMAQWRPSCTVYEEGEFNPAHILIQTLRAEDAGDLPGGD